MRKLFIPVLFCGLLACTQTAKNVSTASIPAEVRMTTDTLRDKVMGGWAGQVIGCTFGGPTEFRFQGTMIQDYQRIPWYDGYIKQTMTDNPGLYDDIYMDLTFVDVFEKQGLDAPAEAHAKAYAQAGYMLWHANQAGRYNVLHGIMPPQSGHWLNNPHADDIDFQIEADFAGLMSPGMPNTASEISDKIGHIMNYGDGWYGGVYMAAMYSLAFVSNDIQFIVKEGLKSIPAQSQFYQCITDVIAWHAKYPDDWKANWFEIEKKWSSDVGCPDGVLAAYNIDAKINAAYVVLGLLYGNGDFTKTLEISTRAGQDSDCNPASAGGILGTMLGYGKIPDYWKMGLKEAEGLDFKYTTVSLNDVYEIGTKHALETLKRNGGKVEGDNVTIAVQQPKPVRLEQAFEGHFPVERKRVDKKLAKPGDEAVFDFEGIGFVLRGGSNQSWDDTTKRAYIAEVFIDGKLAETVHLPTNYTERRYEVCWKYQMPKGKHAVRVRIKEGNFKGIELEVRDAIVYDDKPYAKSLVVSR
ncbi:MAG: ADP-ribosylglycohydrolase family protein [Cytophagales bacterium]|nr:ADP-ribosylglycohydrolase family protein [Cytophagales bacterium]